MELQRTATLSGLENHQRVSCSATETSFDTSTVLRYMCQLLTLGAHAQEGYYSSLCVYVCVCVSVRTLGGHSFVYGFKVRYQRLVHDVLRVFHSLISLEVFRSRVRASFV